MKTVTIYGLRAAGDPAIRYVGQTARSLDKRLASHFKDCAKHDARLQRWLRSVVAGGGVVEIFLLEENAALHEAEKKWIAFHRANGADLVNVTDGGEGNHGYKWTPEQIVAISAIRKGRVITPEWRANMSAAFKGKPKAPGFGAKVSAGKKGKPFSVEHRANIGKARKGKPLSEAHKAALRAAKVGYVMSDEHRQKVRASINERRHLYQDALRAAHLKPEVRASKSKKMKDWWAKRKQEKSNAQTSL